MIGELGQFALALAFAAALLQATLPWVAVARAAPALVAATVGAARGQILCTAVAFGCLVGGFVQNDFSVLYVASHSNSALPLYYRIAATWSAHEGSFLLFSLLLGLWIGAVTWGSRSLPWAAAGRLLGVLGLLSVGFLGFVLFTSNPFVRLDEVPLDGNDLNPLLQDFGLTIHPPMLYMGYVGTAVAFASALAALAEGRLDPAWARWLRPWALAAWAFLTVGIALGSWWAYYELGWGGYWFWDPVENASLMPWLVDTALIHSLATTEKRGLFKAWTVLLALAAFSLSLVGMFLVRSGVLTSVHAFASDPRRGLYILLFLALVVGGSLALYAARAPRLHSVARFRPLSRESLLLLNNALLLVATACVCLGTLYPLFLDAMHLGKISVGAPYFRAVLTPILAPLFLLAGIGPLVAWRQTAWRPLARRLSLIFTGAFAVGLAFAFTYHAATDPVLLGVATIAAFLGLTALYAWLRRATARGPGVPGGLLGLPGASFSGMTLAHLGLAVFLLGVAVADRRSQEQDVRLAPGEAHTLGGYRFLFSGVREEEGPNYTAQVGEVRISTGGAEIAVLHPEKRVYRVQTNMMTEAAIDPSLARDLYVALGEPLEGGAFTLRLYYKPFVRLIWLGGLLMAAGGCLSLLDRRYRYRARLPDPAPGPAPARPPPPSPVPDPAAA
jgi:cytochrome c-type biogenesis protein CcmF